MKKIFFFLFPLALGLAACNTGEKHDHRDPSDPKEAQKVPNITWSNLIARDTIQLGDTARCYFAFFSTGWKSAQILSAKSSQPRSQVEFPSRELVPGDQDTVWVSSVPASAGHYAASIEINHNNPDQPITTLVHFVVILPEE